jgi:DNA-directed RNA polymerase specialized sigma24 family protein
VPLRPNAEAAARADLQLYLQDVLNQMDPVDREVLALRHFEELKNDEAASVLGLERSETSRRYLHAVKALKDILQRIPVAGVGRNPWDSRGGGRCSVDAFMPRDAEH